MKWLRESNRYKHTIMGIVIYPLFMLLSYSSGSSLIFSSIIGLLVTLACMVSVEYKDKLVGNKFDLLDILAGVLVPIILTLIILLI